MADLWFSRFWVWIYPLEATSVREYFSVVLGPDVGVECGVAKVGFATGAFELSGIIFVMLLPLPFGWLNFFLAHNFDLYM